MAETDGERHSPPSLGQSSAMADLFVVLAVGSLCLNESEKSGTVTMM